MTLPKIHKNFWFWLLFAELLMFVPVLSAILIPSTHSQSPQVAYIRNVDEHLDIITINGVQKAAYDLETVKSMLKAQNDLPRAMANWNLAEADLKQTQAALQKEKNNVQDERVMNTNLRSDYHDQSVVLKECSGLLKNTSGGKLGGLLHNPWFQLGETIARDSLLTAQVIKCK